MKDNSFESIPLEDAARSYAQKHSWPVFPCNRDKRPLTANGFKNASKDLERIQAWWTENPQASIGVPTGLNSGFFVLDVDLPDGPESLAQLEGKHGRLPETVEQATGGGGRQLFFRWPSGVSIKNSAGKLARGLDVRGEGGYVILPPSGHASGNQYRWRNWQAPWNRPPAEAPGWLLSLILEKPEAPAAAPAQSAKEGRKYGQGALLNELDMLDSTPEGQRNHRLNKAAFSLGQLVAGGELDRQEAESALLEKSLGVGLERGESVKTIKSGLQSGMKKPRTAPDADVSEGFDLSEDGIALAFAERHKGVLRFCHHTGKWFHWQGSYWKREETKLAFTWARDLCRRMNRDGKADFARAATAAAVERFARADRALAVTSEVWDRDPWLLGTPAGAVDLRSGRVHPPAQDLYITRQTGTAPAEQSAAPLWLKFLQEATRGDEDLIRFLQQVAGYCLTGDISEHALFFVYGPGGNGKSVFLNTLVNILGDYATTAAMDTFTASKGDRHPTELAMLRGARRVSVSETEEGRAWAESRIKQLTGGDKISARFMRQDFFEYKPQFKLLIIGNHKPVLRNVDDAARRRFNIIPFIHKPEEPDKQLEEKLKGEYPAILRWMIEGCLDWQREGLCRPSVVAEATQAYFDEQDLFGQWIEECCKRGPREWETTSRLFASWKDYAEHNGEHPGSVRSIGQSLSKHGFLPDRATVHGTTQRLFRGISLKERNEH